MWVRVAAPCLDPGSFLLPNLAPVFYKTAKNVSTKLNDALNKTVHFYGHATLKHMTTHVTYVYNLYFLEVTSTTTVETHPC